MKILFKYPTFQRSEWFKRTLDKYFFMLSGHYDYKFLITLNSNDTTMNNDDMRTFMNGYSHLEYKYGKHQTKIEACNADMEGEDFDILFLISDDMIPILPGFDNMIVEMMEKYFPEMDGALHFNDGLYGKDRTITLSIMGKKLYDYFGYIYHPAYKSFFCDNEFTEEVMRLKKHIYIPEVIVKHEWTGGPQGDSTYRRNSKLGRPDEATYNRRKAAGFPRS